MIKAEVIIHEGNPGPNWLDRCRTVATPGNITLVVVLLAIVTAGYGIDKHHQTISASKQPVTQSHPASSAAPSKTLEVVPLQGSGLGSTTSNVQGATGGSASSASAADASASKLGAPATPSLNTSSSSNAATGSAGSSSSIQAPLQTLKDTLTNVNKGLNGVTSGLGL